MEQSRGYDPTLPLDFDGSTNMNSLQEVTLGEDPSSHDLSGSTSRTVSQTSGLLFPNLLAKSNSGRMSPVRGRTMKEYDQQITELKKENFSLKLRIYFLEERMQQKYGDGEDVFKTNIELKVNVQSLKKELEDKQELLRKASQAIETLTSSQQSDIDSVKKSLEEQHHKYTEELRSDLQKALQDAEDARDELEGGRERMQEMEVRLQQLDMDQQQSALNAQKLKDAIDMKEREISALQLESDSLSRDLEDTRRQLQEATAQCSAVQHRTQQLEKDLQRRGRDVERLSTALQDTSVIDSQSFLAPCHLQDEVEDQRDHVGHLEATVARLEACLHDRDATIGSLEEGVREKEKALKDATNQLQQLTRDLEEEKRLGGRRDKTVIGLVSSLHKKDNEMASCKAKLSKSEGELKTMKAQLHKAEVARQEMRQLSDQLAESEHSNRRLQTQLTDANVEVEKMIRSLGKKEGELAGFRDQLQQANLALKRSEEALEGLQDQLEKERSQAHSSQEKQAHDYQRMVEDYVHQLQGKDHLMAHMTAQLRAKDQQLSSLMSLLTDDTNQSQKVLLQKLEDDVNSSSDLVQSFMESKQTEVDQKGTELREAREALRTTGRELEQANLLLLEKQEELEKLQLHSRQQGEGTVRLSNTLAKAQQSLEEALDRHAQVVQEKDAIVDSLQKALAEKERMVEELTNQSPSMDKQQQQLRAQLREKDKIIQELQTDCVKASCERDQALRSSQASLLEKDRQIQALDQKHQKEVVNRDQEIQQLMAQLSRKDVQLEGLQSRLDDAQAAHRDLLHSMTRSMDDKDKTIQALMDSVGEKERLLRRSQQNLTEDAKAQMAEMDTLLAENSRMKCLLREKEAEALREEVRQRSHCDNRETHHTSYHDTVTHTGDNAQVCRLLEEQIRESRALSELLHQDRQQVLVNLTTEHHPSDSHSREEGGGGSSTEALQAELSAVSALRQRLLEGVEKHQQLHRSLLGHSSRHADHLLSGDTSPDSESHQPPSLSIPRYHHHHPPGQQPGSWGEEESEGGGPSGVRSSGSVGRPLDHSLGHQGDAASTSGGGGGERTSSLAIQTSPFLTHTLFERGGPLSRGAASDPPHPHSPGCAGAGEGKGVLSHHYLLGHSLSEEEGLAREPSQHSVASSVNSLSSAELAVMSAPVLRDLVSQLQEDLVAAAQRNAALQRELRESQGGGSCLLPAESETGGHGGTVDDLQEQVESLRKALQLKDEETARLRQHLGLPPEPGASSLPPPPTSDLHSQVHHLRHQVKDMDKVNQALKQQIAVSKASGSASGQEGDAVRQRILSMAQEIERLRAENCQLSVQVKRGRQGSGMQEVWVGGDVSDGISTLETDPSGSSVMSPSSPTLLAESFSQDLSRNTNRRADSALSQGSVSQAWSSLAPQSASLSSHSDSEWAPRMMQGEGGIGSRLPPLAKTKRSGKEAGGGSPLLTVGHSLQESQEQVRSLEERLVATEGTVRYMSQRLRHYRCLLHAVKGGKRPQDGPVGGLPRSTSESFLFAPHSRLSLSLSCSDLLQAAQSSGGLAAEGARDADVSPTVGAEQGGGQKVKTSSRNSHAFVNTLNQHIKAMRERYSPGVDTGKPGTAQVGGHTWPTQQEDDGGSNMSQLSCASRDTVRRDPAPHLTPDGRLAVQGGKDTSDNTTITVSDVTGSRSDVSNRQIRRMTTSMSLRHHHIDSSLAPGETTMSGGEDVLDGTAMDNLTYYSFSESILPMGQPEGHREGAWSFARGPGQQGKPDSRQGGEKEGQSAENTEGTSSSGEEETPYDGNGTLHSNPPSNDSGASQETSRLQNRVMVLTDMNRTLREELSVYDALCQSLGVQVSAVGEGESGGEESDDGQIRLLRLHLAELKRLRECLEQLDTEAQNAVQMTSLLNSEHVRRIAELEAVIAQLRHQLSQQRALSDQRQTTIIEHERVITDTKIVRERQEKEIELLRENLSALQDCETQRLQQQEAEMAELQQQIAALRAELEESQRQTRELEGELEESQQRRQSYDVKFSQSQQHLTDLENQLSRAKRRAKGLESELHTVRLSCTDLQARLATAEAETAALHDEARGLRQSAHTLDSELSERTRRATELQTRLEQAETARSETEKELGDCQGRLRELEGEVRGAQRESEELRGRVGEEEEKGRQLQEEVARAREESEQRLQAQSHALREECQQQRQRAQHYQERMAHYEHCLRDSQLHVQECEAQVCELKQSLQSSQGREQEAEGRRHQTVAQLKQLQGQLKDAESRAHTNENMAHRADTLARTLEARLREMESKVKDTEERTKELEYELQVSQSTASERSVAIETLKKEASERSAKLKKRDAQLTKLVPEYKKVYGFYKELEQLNQALKTEIKMYESMTSQTVSCSKKEDLMRELLQELSRTRRLAEDVISRLEHSKRNDSPASIAGPEAADGRPSPEPREGLMSEVSALQVQLDGHSSLGHSQASSLSEQSLPPTTDSPAPCTPLSSPGGSTYSASGARPKTVPGDPPQEGGGEVAGGQSLSRPDWEGEGQKSADGSGVGHLRSYSHPASLKYWRDHPLAALSGPAGAPKVEVDSDVRRLFAISSLDGYEKLKRENSELLAILSSMQTRVAERLKAFIGVPISESVEYSTLRELQMSADNLRICAQEEGRLLSCFWLTQLPPLNARGEFYDPKLADENENLKVELRKQKSRYDLLVHTVREQQERLHATNALRKKWETTLYKQLSHTSGILERSKENFDHAGLTPPKPKSPRKPGPPIKDKN